MYTHTLFSQQSATLLQKDPLRILQCRACRLQCINYTEARPGLSPECLKSAHLIASRAREVGWTSVALQLSFLACVIPPGSTPALSLQIAALPTHPTLPPTLKGPTLAFANDWVGTAVLSSLSGGSCHTEGRCDILLGAWQDSAIRGVLYQTRQS